MVRVEGNCAILDSGPGVCVVCVDYAEAPVRLRSARRLALILSLLIGVGWLVVVLFLVLSVGGWGLTSLKTAALSILGLTAFFAPPLCLIVGSTLGLLRKAPASSFGACAFGSLCLSAVAGNSVYSDLHRNSAEVSSGLRFLAALVIAALFCNLCAIWLGIDWKRNRLTPGV